MSALDVLSDLELCQHLYEPDFYGGLLRWKKPLSRKSRVGNMVGHRRKQDGRYVVLFRGKACYGYRILYLMYHGEWPANQVDHFDQNPTNDCISNLRDVTNEQNSWNKGIHSKNKTGVTGVHVNGRGQYVAMIHIKGKSIYIGSFTELKAARMAREEYQRAQMWT